MAFNEKNLQSVYETLKKEGYTPPEFDVFAKDMRDDENLRGVHDTLMKEGYTPPEFDSFKTDMFGELNQEWDPNSVQGRIRMVAGVDDIVRSTKQSLDKSVEQTDRIAQRSFTDDGRKVQKGVDMFARMNGLQTKPLGLIDPAASDSEKAGQSESESKEPERKLNAISPVVNSVRLDENGKPVAEWMLPDGSVTTDFTEADIAETNARKDRLVKEFVSRAKDAGYNPKNPEDIKQFEIEEQLRRNEARQADKMHEVADNYRKDFEWDENEGFFANLGRLAAKSIRASEGVVSDARLDEESDKDLNNLKTEHYILDNALKRRKAGQLKKSEGIANGFFDMKNNAVNFAHGVKDKLTDPDFYLGGMVSFKTQQRMMELDQKLRNGGNLTGSDLDLAYSVLLNLDAETSSETPHGYRAAQTIVEMAPFMIQMMANPASGLGKAMVSRFGKSAMKKFGKAALKKHGKLFKAGAVAANVAGDVAEAAVLTNTLQAPRTAADIMHRYTGDAQRDEKGNLSFDGEHDMSEAIVKGELAGSIENYTELLGEHFGIIGNWLGGKIVSGAKKIGMGKFIDRTADLITNVKSTQFAKAVSKMEEKAKWNGSFGEMLEEETGILLNSIITGDNSLSDLTDADQQIDILLGVGLFGGFVSGMKTGVYGSDRMYRKNMLDRATVSGSMTFGDRWTEVKSRMDDAENQELRDMVVAFNRDARLGKISKEEANAVNEYALRLQQYRGENIARAKADNEGAATAEQEKIGSAFDKGYSAESAEDRQRIMHDYDNARVLAERHVPEFLEAFEQDKESAIRNLPSMYGEDQDAIDLANEYVEAACMHDGFLQRSRDMMESAAYEAESGVRQRVHKQSGKIQGAVTTKGDHVDITDGNIVRYENGAIDLKQSDQLIYARDTATGKVVQLSPRDIESLDEAIDAGDLMAEARERAAYETALGISEAVDGIVSGSGQPAMNTPQRYSIDDELELRTPEGEVVHATVVSALEDGKHQVQIEGSQGTSVMQLTPQQISGMQVDGNAAPVAEATASDSLAQDANIEGQDPAPDGESSYLQRIPRDEEGEPVFEQAETPELGWDALVEYRNGDAAKARVAVDKLVEIKGKALEKLRKQQPKGNTMKEIIASQDAIDAEVANAQADYDSWQAIANVPKSREEAEARAEQERMKVEAEEEARIEAERQAEEQRWIERKEKMDRRLRQTAETVKECPEALEILENTAPQDIWEAASWVLSVNRLIPRNEGVLKGFREMTGYKSGEQRKMVGLFAKTENGGTTLERLAEDAMQSVCEEHGIPYDNSSALNALLDVLQSCGTLGDIRSYIENNRIDQAMRYYEQWRSQMEWTPEEEAEYEDHLFRQEYGCSREDYEREYEMWNEYMRDNLGDIDSDFDVNEFYGNIADEIAGSVPATNTIENGNRQRETSPGEPGGDGTVPGDGSQGAGALSGGGGELLQPQASVHAPGAGADVAGSGVHEENGDGVAVPPQAVSSESSGGELTGQKGNNVNLFGYFGGSLQELINRAKESASGLVKKIIAPVSERLRADLSSKGVDVDDSYKHVIDNNAIRHALKNHGGKSEEKRGQIPITDEDFGRLEDIVSNYDRIDVESGKRGNDNIIYSKSYEDGTTIFVEEKRVGRKELAAVTMWKKKNPTRTDANRTEATPISDLSGISDGKDNTLSSDKQEDREESSVVESSETENGVETPEPGQILTPQNSGEARQDAEQVKKLTPLETGETPQVSGETLLHSGEEKIQARRDAGKTIEDFGEKIAGARKDALKEVAKSVENVTVQSLIELPLGKAFKRPNLKKMVDAGILSSEDALLGEAVMEALVYGRKKPVLTRKKSSHRDVAEWADQTYAGIRLLGDVLSGDAARRDKALEEYRAGLKAKQALTDEYIEKLRGWNPGRTFGNSKEVPDMVAVFGEIFSALNHQPGDKLDLPLSVMKLSDDGQSYIVSGSGKQGALWFSGYHGTLHGAVDTMILAARLKRGDMDVELPESQFRIKGIGIRHSEPTGRYTVGYLGGRNGFDYKEKTFDDEQSAAAFAKEKEGVVKPEVRYLNEYDGYRVSVTNPLTGKSHEIGETFGTRAEASAWLDEMHDEANSRALEAIGTEMGQKRRGREHFYISSTWSTRRKGMLFSVMEDRKDIPWPVIKDFDSRAEAESWLKENKERLEALRKERKERERNIVYFNNDESRVGKDWRQGRDADAEMFTEAFGFRGVQFGNWTNDRDRQEALNQAYDSLMDMATFLGLSPRALSLDGELGLAFGARGSGSALAHYEPGEVVINLTKTRGAGSLGHEWFHALDNFMSRSNGVALGMTTKGHGLDGMNPSVRAAFESLVKGIVNSEYGKRSRARGEYWGREEEMAARLFETWVNSELSKKGEHSPFLVGGLKIDSIRKFQLWNYLEYEMQESVKADREGREPQLMSKEEFNELPESLKGYPYPTERELGEFAPLLETLFNALSSRESEAGSLAGEASAGYHVNDRNGRYPRKGQTAAGMSLFDWADRNERSHRDADARDEELIASEETNASIDVFVEDYRDYLDRSEALEREISELPEGSEERVESEELLDHEEVRIIEARGMLHERLRDFYVRNNTPEDADRIARDMLARVMAEVEVRRNRTQILRDILDGGTDAGVETPEHDQILTRQEERGELEASQGDVAAVPEQTQGSVRTAGGGIRYEAVGHLPDAQAGEFAYVERQFSRSGEFLFMGADKIRDRGDVAYLFRSLENYSIEHVFAVLVKDGRAKVVHIGMGGPTASYAYLGAVRAAYDAFGADKIYLVHNHPSGNLIASPQDQKLMASIEKAFGGKADSEGVIMDTTSGRYSTFHGSGRAEEHVRPQTGEESDAEVLRFDRQNSGTEVAELSKIRNSRDVSEFLTSLRLGDRSKVSYLVLSNSNHIIGNFHTDYSDMSGGLAEEIASTAVKYGGNRVVVYGNVPLTRSQMLKDNVKALSLDGVQVLDVMDMTDGIHRSAMDEGMMREPDSDYSSASRIEAEEDVRFRLGSSAASFDERLNRAVAEKGTVMPGLNDAEVTVVDVPRHEYEGDRILSQAVDAAAQRYAGRVLHYNNHGAEFDYEIKPQSLKYAANHAQKSENIGVHAAVMNHLDAVIRESIEVMEHADVHKTSGKRSEENGYNPDSLMHRFVGAVNISGQTYRVISTLKEYAGDKLNRHHTYEVIKIEVLDAETPSTSNGTTTRDESQVEVAKILKDCEIHNKSGEKILRESALADSGVEPEGMEREGSGEISDDDLSFHNDPWSRAWGESIRTAKKRKEYAARYRGYMRARVRELAKILHLDNVELLEDGSSLSGNKASAKGFFSTRDGKITVILSNNISTEDIEQTLLHEAVAHYGLRKLFGEHFSVFLRNVYANAEADVRQRINALMAKNVWDVDLATEEYLASLAERIDFEHDSVFSEWWRKVKSLFIDMLHKIGLKDFTGVTLSDNELRYILWSSYQNLKDPGSREPIFGAARDVAMQDSLKVGNYAEHQTLTDDAAADAMALYDVNERFNEHLEKLGSGEVRNGELNLGQPGAILRSAGIDGVRISLQWNVLQKKMNPSYVHNHPFTIEDVKNLPLAINNPIAIFESKGHGDFNILVNLEKDGKNFVVSLEAKRKSVRGGEIVVDDIVTLYPKEVKGIINWINTGLGKVYDKEKTLEWLRTCETHNRHSAIQELDDAAKIVENFENPKTDVHNDNNSEDEGVLLRPGAPSYSPRDRAIARDAYNSICASGGYQFREAMQDSMLGLKTLYQSILGKDTRIEDVAGFENAYLFENRVSSMNATHQYAYFHTYMKPLLDAIYDITGKSDEERRILTDYLMAKHGLERNAHMRAEAQAKGERTDRDFAGLTGLTGKQSWRTAGRTISPRCATDRGTSRRTTAQRPPQILRPILPIRQRQCIVRRISL